MDAIHFKAVTKDVEVGFMHKIAVKDSGNVVAVIDNDFWNSTDIENIQVIGINKNGINSVPYYIIRLNTCVITIGYHLKTLHVVPGKPIGIIVDGVEYTDIEFVSTIKYTNRCDMLSMIRVHPNFEALIDICTTYLENNPYILEMHDILNG